MVVCLGRDADLYMAHLIPLPLTVSCSRKSRLVLILRFLVPAHKGSPDILGSGVKCGIFDCLVRNVMAVKLESPVF